MGKMRDLLSRGEFALFGILGEAHLSIANSNPTLAKVRITANDTVIFEGEASLGQLRALAKETARALNNLLELQKIEHQKVEVDNEVLE